MGLLNRQAHDDHRRGPDFKGRDLLTLPPDELRHIRGKDIAMVFQDPFACLHPMYRVGDQIAEAVHAHRTSAKDAARARAVELLDHVGIPNAKSRARDYPHQFSGGMRQRAMIAMALVHNPSILIADEPTTALDVTVQAQILELIEEVKREFDIGVILVTHDLGVVAETANSVMVMYAGRDHGVRPGARDLRAAAAPVHLGAARLDADDRATARARSCRSRARRRRCSTARPAARSIRAARYRFEPCATERPPLVAPVPEAHPDACHLAVGRQACGCGREARGRRGSETAA